MFFLLLWVNSTIFQNVYANVSYPVNWNIERVFLELVLLPCWCTHMNTIFITKWNKAFYLYSWLVNKLRYCINKAIANIPLCKQRHHPSFAYMVKKCELFISLKTRLHLKFRCQNDIRKTLTIIWNVFKNVS